MSTDIHRQYKENHGEHDNIRARSSLEVTGNKYQENWGSLTHFNSWDLSQNQDNRKTPFLY